MKYEISSYNTKAALSNALKTALKKQPFSKITVNELVEACHFNRKTFYYHFEDKYALLKWMIQNEAINAVKQIDLSENYEEGVRFIIHYLNENNRIIKAAYNSIGRDEMKNILYDDFYSIVYDFLSKKEHKSKLYLDEAFKKFVCKFYTEAAASVIHEWICRGKKADTEDSVRSLIELMKITLPAILAEKGRKKHEVL